MVWLALAENSTGVGRRIAAAGNSNQNAGRGRGARPFTLELNCLDSDERSPCAPPFAVDGRRPRVSRTVVTAAVEGATCLMQISPVYFLLPTVCSFPAVQSGAARYGAVCRLADAGATKRRTHGFRSKGVHPPNVARLPRLGAALVTHQVAERVPS